MLDDGKISELLVKSQAGDKEAYQEFFYIIHPFVESMVTRKVFNKDDRDDVVQQILLGIHKSLETYDNKRSALTWIKSIVHYKVIDYIRKSSKLQEKEVFTEDGDVTIFTAASNNKLEALEIIESLPENLREPLILTKIKGHDTKEAAEILGIKENALRTRISRALKMINKFLLENNYE